MALIFTLTFLAVGLLTLAVFTLPFSSRARVKQALGDLGAYEAVDAVPGRGDESFTSRVIQPALNRINMSLRNLNNEKRVARTAHNLVLGGIRHIDAEKFLTLKTALAGGALIFYLLVVFPFSIATGRSLIWGLLLIPLLFFIPDFWLQRKIDGRQKEIAVSVADTIDVLTIGIEAGLAFDSAIAKIARNMDGPLAEEFGRMLGELQIGVSRAEAIRALGTRTTVPELKNFCTTLVQADKLGISIAKILKTEAVELREKRRQAAEEKAMKLPVKVVFPIVLCILPALMVVVIGPGIIRIIDAFGG